MKTFKYVLNMGPSPCKLHRLSFCPSALQRKRSLYFPLELSQEISCPSVSLKRTLVLSFLEPYLMASAILQMAHFLNLQCWSLSSPHRLCQNSFFKKHFSELDMNEAGSYSKLSWQVCAVNISLVLREQVHPPVCTEICKVFRSLYHQG